MSGATRLGADSTPDRDDHDTTDTTDITETAEILSQLPQVDYTVVTAGVYDILIEVVCADDDELLSLLRQLRSIEHVESTETMMYLKLWDQKYNWGTR